MLKDKLDLQDFQSLRPHLYARGFLITDNSSTFSNKYPFYNFWSRQTIGPFHFWIHKDSFFYTYSEEHTTLFLIGHAYDPFSKVFNETAILEKLYSVLQQTPSAFWEEESKLTGNFLIGWVKNNTIVCSGDAVGMQITYYGQANGNMYISSFSKLIDDLCGLSRDEYVDRLISSRYYPYFGLFLPGDISPFTQLKRLPANHFLRFCSATSFAVTRYYPLRPICYCPDNQTSYQALIDQICEILENSMDMISRKWPHGRAAISVTGGKDSTTTLACSKRFYDRFSYFSYISADKESVDAYAAHEICNALNLPHKIYHIPQRDLTDKEFLVFQQIMEYNFGCIGTSKRNEIDKRLFFSSSSGFHDFDIEVKSWVDEISRARLHKRYHKRHFPKTLSPRMCTTLYKIFLFDRKLAIETDRIFKSYLSSYYSKNIFQNIPWWDLFYWEFLWGSGEALFLTAEQKISYDITIPYNNRILLEKMLSAPLHKRINDDLQRDIILQMDRRIADTNISIRDVGYSSTRTIAERLYLEIHSHIPF